MSTKYYKRLIRTNNQVEQNIVQVVDFKTAAFSLCYSSREFQGEKVGFDSTKLESCFKETQSKSTTLMY